MSITSGPHTGPCPGTIVSAPSADSRSSALSEPVMDPCSRNGVPPLEQQVAAEEDTTFGDPHDRVVGRVRRRADVGHLALEVVGVDLHLVGERQERWSERDVPPVDLVPHRGQSLRTTELHDELADALPTDDGGTLEQEVAVGVITVVVGVDQGADRRAR